MARPTVHQANRVVLRLRNRDGVLGVHAIVEGRVSMNVVMRRQPDILPIQEILQPRRIAHSRHVLKESIVPPIHRLIKKVLSLGGIVEDVQDDAEVVRVIRGTVLVIYSLIAQTAFYVEDLVSEASTAVLNMDKVL